MVDPPVGHKFTPKTTPLHVYQLVMQLLRITMTTISEDDDFPFLFTDNAETTGVVLDTVYNKEAPTFGKKPLIVVSRGNMSSQIAGMGDTVDARLGRTLQYKTSMVQSSVQIKTIAKHSGEVDILSNIIYNFLLTCRTVLPSLTSIHSIQGVSMSPVAQFEESDHLYYTQASIEFIMQYQWTWDFTPMLFDKIGFYLNNKLIIDL